MNGNCMKQNLIFLDYCVPKTFILISLLQLLDYYHLLYLTKMVYFLPQRTYRLELGNKGTLRRNSHSIELEKDLFSLNNYLNRSRKCYLKKLYSFALLTNIHQRLLYQISLIYKLTYSYLKIIPEERFYYLIDLDNLYPYNTNAYRFPNPKHDHLN